MRRAPSAPAAWALAVAAGAVGLVGVHGGGDAAAQSCHAVADVGPAPAAAGDHAHHDHQPGHAPPVLRGLAALGLGAATVVDGDAAVSYQSVALAAQATWRRLTLRADLRGYQLARDGATSRGLGDLVIAPWVAVVERPRLHVVLGLPTSLPTGDADADLGMGHVMLMPTAMVSMAHGASSATVIAQGGWAVGADEHAHHDHGAAAGTAGPPGPIVAPMSASEVGATLRLGHQVARRLGVNASAGAVVPLGDDPARGLLGVGAAVGIGRGQLEATVERGVLSRPVGSSGSLTLSWPLR